MVLNRVSEFVGLKDKLVGIRNKVKERIADTNRTIAKIDSFGKGMREAGQKKVYESMVFRLDAAIDKVEDLSRDVELDHMEKKQAGKPENVTDISEEITLAMSVAEPSE